MQAQEGQHKLGALISRRNSISCSCSPNRARFIQVREIDESRDVRDGEVMRVHFIYAHPASTSFTAAVRDRILAGLKTQGHQVDELDLYAARFNPVLRREEWGRYLKPDDNLVGIEDCVERLRAAEALVLCFPTWWYGMPAILKGWFDRIWAPGVAFHLPETGGPISAGSPTSASSPSSRLMAHPGGSCSSTCANRVKLF
jgi:putative NADPH-quinone reductase